MEQPKRLYVGNLPWKTTSDSLRAHFETCGHVVDVAIPREPGQERIRGFGFVEFNNAEDAALAKESLHNVEFEGRLLQVNFATVDVGRRARRSREG